MIGGVDSWLHVDANGQHGDFGEGAFSGSQFAMRLSGVASGLGALGVPAQALWGLGVAANVGLTGVGAYDSFSQDQTAQGLFRVGVGLAFGMQQFGSARSGQRTAVLDAAESSGVDTALRRFNYLNAADPSEAALLQNLQTVPEIPGVTDIVGHGTDSTFQVSMFGKDFDLSPQELASKMIADGHQGEPVRLLSCGVNAPGATFAQDYANALDAPVYAPNGRLWIRGDGSGTMYIGPRAGVVDPGGRFSWVFPNYWRLP